MQTYEKHSVLVTSVLNAASAMKPAIKDGKRVLKGSFAALEPSTPALPPVRYCEKCNEQLYLLV